MGSIRGKERKMKKVSLIIPIYNSEKYLRRCLESAILQTYINMEIICVDDGSIDSSGIILDEFAKMDERIIAVHQENKGESAARNVGLGKATGDYIGFLDCDDWIEPEMYAELVYALEKNNVDMAASGWIKETENESMQIVNKKLVESRSFDRNQLLKYIYERDSYRAFAYMWNKLYRRNLFFDRSGKPILFNENLILGGDVLLLGEIAINTKKAVYIDKAFYHYYQREDSSIHTKQIERRKHWLVAYQLLIEIFENHKIDTDIIDLVKRFLAYHSSNLAEIAYQQKNQEALLFCQDIMRQYKKIYIKLNCDHIEYIQRYNRILACRVRKEDGINEMEK